VAGGHLMLLVTRATGPFWRPPFPAGKLFWAIVATQLFAVLMCAYGWGVPQVPWSLIGWVWLYNLIWMLVQDIIKLRVYHELALRATGRTPFLARLKASLDPHGNLHHG